MNKLSKQTAQKMTKSYSSNYLRPIQSLIVRKLNQKEKRGEIIKKEIHDCLNLPEKFLSSNSKVTIGKRIKIKDLRSIGIIPIAPKKAPTPNKRMSLYRKSFNFNNNNITSSESLRNSIATSHFSLYKEKQQKEYNEKYDVIDNEQLKKIFNKYKTLHIPKKNAHKKNNSIIISESIKNSHSSIKIDKKDIPKEITESLTFQNNKLKIRQKFDNRLKNISKRLAKLVNKKEKDLLLNRVYDYHLKKELLKEIDFNKPRDEKYGIYKWNISLRRPDNFEGNRNSYINLTRDENPFWGIIVEKYPQIKEIKIKPGSLSQNKEFFSKLKKAHFPLINYKNLKNLENLEQLRIKGENLFNIEYNREVVNNNGKKIMHKTFIDKGGKVILKTEINSVFGETTFCENYSGNNLLSTNLTNISNNNSIYNTSKFPYNLKNYSKTSATFKDMIISSISNDEITKKRTFNKSKSSDKV